MDLKAVITARSSYCPVITARSVHRITNKAGAYTWAAAELSELYSAMHVTQRCACHWE